MADFDFSYDMDNDDLFLFKKDAKSSGSVELGELIFDFDYRLNLVGIQISNASDFIAEISEEPVAKELLVSLNKCIVKQTIHTNLIVIIVVLLGKKKIQFPLTIPNINTSSPVLTYA